MGNKEGGILRRDQLDEQAVARLGALLSSSLQPGDLITLSGTLGAGKSVMARAILRGLKVLDDIPSPTFTLIQHYPHAMIPAHHADLYRLQGGDDVLELGLEECLQEGILLVEWPDRLGNINAISRLDIRLESAGDNMRHVMAMAQGSITQRLGSWPDLG